MQHNRLPLRRRSFRRIPLRMTSVAMHRVKLRATELVRDRARYLGRRVGCGRFRLTRNRVGAGILRTRFRRHSHKHHGGQHYCRSAQAEAPTIRSTVHGMGLMDWKTNSATPFIKQVFFSRKKGSEMTKVTFFHLPTSISFALNSRSCSGRLLLGRVEQQQVPRHCVRFIRIWRLYEISFGAKSLRQIPIEFDLGR